MIKKLKYLFVRFIVLAVLVFSVACDDEKAETDEWMANYVYIERPVLGSDSKEFNLTHEGSGITGDTEILMPITVRLSKPCKSDVRVKLNYTIEGGMPEEIVSFLKGGTVLIPAGELFNRDTLNINTDWSFVPYSKATYKAMVDINSIEPVSEELRISSRQSSLNFIVNKSAYLNMSFSTTVVPSGASISDRAAWTIAIQSDVENSENPGRLVDGSTGTDIASGLSSFWLTIDLNKTATVTGFRIRHWGSNYAPRGVEIYTSDDGINWASQGQLTTSGSNQYICFLSPVTCRHIKYDIITGASSGRTSLTEFYVYEQ